MAVNATAKDMDREPLLEVSRDRLIKRTKSPAKIKTEGPICRTGTMRIAAFFDTKAVDRVKAAAKEFGLSQEKMIQAGLQSICGVSNDDGVAETREVDQRQAA
jgi:hypothetical protein